jgi:hypothetical protein
LTKTVTPATIQAAVAIAKPLDVLRCVPGTYPGIVVNKRPGQVDAPITLEAEEPGTVEFVGAAPGKNDCLYFNGSPRWILRGLKAKGGATVLYLGSSSFVEVLDSEFYGGRVQGIRAGSSRGVLVDSVFIHDITEQHGIYNAGGEDASDWVIRRSRMCRVGRAGVQANAQAKLTPIRNLHIVDCRMWDCGLQNAAAVLNMIGVHDSLFERLYLNGKAGGVSFSGFAATTTKPLQVSTGNVLRESDVFFNLGEGRQCVLASDPSGTTVHSVNTVERCRLRMGRSTVPATAERNGAVLFQSDVTIIPPGTEPVPTTATGSGV